MTTWLTEAELDAWLPFIAVTEMLPGALNGQLRRDSELDHFEYMVLAMLSESDDPGRLRLTALASRTNATLARLSRVVSRLETEGLLTRGTDAGDRRTTIATLTDDGWNRLYAAAPGHVTEVRRLIFDHLSPDEVDALRTISRKVLAQIDPEGRMRAGAHDPP